MPDKTIQVNLAWRFERIFLRKANIELHEAPEVFDMKWQPNVDMNIHGRFHKLAEQRFDVSLEMKLTCKNLDKLAFELDLHQSALVIVNKDQDPDEVKRILAVEATNALFPYTREAVDNLVLRMSLPPMMLAHFNFDKVFEEGERQLKAQVGQQADRVLPSSDEVLN
ncbi:MAG: protein-export chaperone SecB [Gammaproteobacteria bacterium]|nr:protein-export chaperone SecB [Gammaproteobacteria bacterium]